MRMELGMEERVGVETNILDATSKLRITYNMIEGAITTGRPLPVITNTELRDLLVLLADVQNHLEEIDKTLFPEKTDKAA